MLDAELRRMLRGTVVVRGKSPYPVRTVLPLTTPESLAEQAEAPAVAPAPVPVAPQAKAAPVEEPSWADPVRRISDPGATEVLPEDDLAPAADLSTSAWPVEKGTGRPAPPEWLTGEQRVPASPPPRRRRRAAPPVEEVAAALTEPILITAAREPAPEPGRIAADDAAPATTRMRAVPAEPPAEPPAGAQADAAGIDAYFGWDRPAAGRPPVPPAAASRPASRSTPPPPAAARPAPPAATPPAAAHPAPPPIDPLDPAAPVDTRWLDDPGVTTAWEAVVAGRTPEPEPAPPVPDWEEWARQELDRAVAERAAAQRAAQEAAEKAAREKAARDKAARDKAAQEKAAHEKAAHEKAAHEKAAQRGSSGKGSSGAGRSGEGRSREGRPGAGGPGERSPGDRCPAGRRGGGPGGGSPGGASPGGSGREGGPGAGGAPPVAGVAAGAGGRRRDVCVVLGAIRAGGTRNGWSGSSPTPADAEADAGAAPAGGGRRRRPEGPGEATSTDATSTGRTSTDRTPADRDLVGRRTGPVRAVAGPRTAVAGSIRSPLVAGLAKRCAVGIPAGPDPGAGTLRRACPSGRRSDGPSCRPHTGTAEPPARAVLGRGRRGTPFAMRSGRSTGRPSAATSRRQPRLRGPDAWGWTGGWPGVGAGPAVGRENVPASPSRSTGRRAETAATGRRHADAPGGGRRLSVAELAERAAAGRRGAPRAALPSGHRQRQLTRGAAVRRLSRARPAATPAAPRGRRAADPRRTPPAWT